MTAQRKDPAPRGSTSRKPSGAKHGSISGRVLSELGAALDGVEVTATGPDGSAPSVMTVGGRYSITGLAPGAYVVTVRQPAGYLDTPQRPVTVAAGANVSDVEFLLQPRTVATGPTGPVPPAPTSPPPPTGTFPTPPTPVTLPSPTGVAPTMTSPGHVTAPTGPTPPGGGNGSNSTTELNEFRRMLLSDELNIEGPVAEDEALEAIALFAVSNVLLAGLARRRVGTEDKVDVLGMLTLYYGLQDKSLATRVVLNSRDLWRATLADARRVEDELKSLRDVLDRLGDDVTFVSREAKRQFNLGVNNDVLANVAFPGLMRRLIDIAADPRLTLNLREEENPRSVTSKDKVGEAYDLLAALKGVALQIVRSLSRYGTIAVRRTNRDWAGFENRAFAVLKKTGEQRFTEDVDDRRILSVLADLLDKNFDTVISPYFAMARNGTALLALAFETYFAAKSELDAFDRAHLLTVFQPPGPPAGYLTSRMRSHALVLKRYPMQAWN